MTVEVGKGTWLESLNDWPEAESLPGLVKGALYQVAELQHDVDPCTICGEEQDGIDLVGIINKDWCYCLCQFKPLDGEEERSLLKKKTLECV